MNIAISSRLEELYRVLSYREKRELARFLQSPYFNRDKNLVSLHHYFGGINFASNPPSKYKAWNAVFKTAPYSEKKFRYIVSDLISAIEEFIFIGTSLKFKSGYIHSLDEYFTGREASVNKASLAEKIKKGTKIKRATISPEFYLEQHYESELITELHQSSLKAYSRHIAEHRSNEPSGLDLFYVIEKLRQLCTVANDNNILGVAIRSFYENEILELASSGRFSGNPFVKAYLSVFFMLTKKSEQYYFQLKKLVDRYGYDFEDKNLAELFLYARNFCIGKINAGEHRFFNEIFDLYEQGLSKRVLLLNGEISEQNYKNIVTTGLRIGKHQWVFDFISEYRYRLNKAVWENAYNYNLANYFFHAGKFDKALQHLQKVSLTDLFYGLDARSLMLKCYFELDEHEAFLNTYYSFRVFVMRRKNVSVQHRRNYLNFLRIAKKLMNLRPRDKKNVLKIQEEIKTQKALADKSWLEDKLRVLMD